MTYRSIQQIKKANRESGGEWFSRSTMKFFNTAIESKVIDGKYFIYSIHGDPRWDRWFKVAFCDPTGRIWNIGPVEGYKSPEEAKANIEKDMTEYNKYLN